MMNRNFCVQRRGLSSSTAPSASRCLPIGRAAAESRSVPSQDVTFLFAVVTTQPAGTALQEAFQAAADVLGSRLGTQSVSTHVQGVSDAAPAALSSKATMTAAVPSAGQPAGHDDIQMQEQFKADLTTTIRMVKAMRGAGGLLKNKDGSVGLGALRMVLRERVPEAAGVLTRIANMLSAAEAAADFDKSPTYSMIDDALRQLPQDSNRQDVLKVLSDMHARGKHGVGVGAASAALTGADLIPAILLYMRVKGVARSNKGTLLRKPIRDWLLTEAPQLAATLAHVGDAITAQDGPADENKAATYEQLTEVLVLMGDAVRQNSYTSKHMAGKQE